MGKVIHIRGAQRTGNNFLIAMLKSNLDVRVIGKSHRPIKSSHVISKHANHFITTIKNPYSWCISITNWARSSWNKDWHTFTWDKNWHEWVKLYEYYNNFYKINFEFHNSYNVPSFIIPYEDFLASTEEKLKLISERCDIKFKTTEIIIPSKIRESKMFTSDCKKFYLKNGTFGLSREMVDKINECVDWEVMSHYGYEKK